MSENRLGDTAMRTHLSNDERHLAGYAGFLYLIIIVCGIGAEVVLRGPLLNFADANSTANAIRENSVAFQLAIAADMIMALADIALALLLYRLFRSVAPMLALAAMVFRLVQAVLIAANLMNMQIAWLLLTGAQDIAALGVEQHEAISNLFLHVHAHGYDLGLVFFGVNSILMGLLVWRADFLPGWLGVGLVITGCIYMLGSALRFFAPAAHESFLPVYGITLLMESAFCLWLLLVRFRRISIRES